MPNSRTFPWLEKCLSIFPDLQYGKGQNPQKYTKHFENVIYVIYENQDVIARPLPRKIK